ncbi:hypothetical protein Cni_G07338 [Canna indica]|uniref:Uncharacterized protein n=1 Tax=Canna indica TaxID=4628 RepID=A0AAQ3JYK0_9LILI|nr:hypothetical protein Cni_G07338 [Canna indica]
MVCCQNVADPAEVLNVPVVPLGALLAAAYPLSSRPPYVLTWLNDQISAQDMMHPELFAKLVFNNFYRYVFCLNHVQNQLCNCDVPILTLAGDLDLICPPEAVYEIVKLIPKEMVTYKVFGKANGPHYAHCDLVGGRLAEVSVKREWISEFKGRLEGGNQVEEADYGSKEFLVDSLIQRGGALCGIAAAVGAGRGAAAAVVPGVALLPHSSRRCHVAGRPREAPTLVPASVPAPLASRRRPGKGCGGRWVRRGGEDNLRGGDGGMRLHQDRGRAVIASCRWRAVIASD